MKEPELPLSGYSIDRIVSTRQELADKVAHDDEAEHGALRFGFDWQAIDDKVFDVRISVAVEPSSDRPEFISANVIGRFRQVSEAPSIPTQEFAGLQAVAILLPYARQLLSSLTANSLYGPYYLPTLNVNRLMRGFKVSPAASLAPAGASARTGRHVGLQKRASSAVGKRRERKSDAVQRTKKR